jgi:pimeloyl-ACP methyl ester carboxylesterase
VPATTKVPSSDGVTIAVHDLGGESDEVLVVCHATGFCGRAYEPLAAELTWRFHVVALDFRGHGDSSLPANGNFDWEAMTDDLLAVLAAVASDRPVVGFGHSMGGAALLLAELRSPGLLRAAHLFEPIVLPGGDPTAAGSVSLAEIARKRRATFPSKAEALYRYASRPPLNVLQAGALAAYVEHGMEELPDGSARLKCAPEVEAATFDATGKPTVDLLHEVRTPVTVAVGTTERGWTPAVYGPAIARALPHGRLERHPLLGHFGPLQGPATVGAMILSALG